MVPIILGEVEVKTLLAGVTTLEVKTPRLLKKGELVYVREAWRGWNCAAADPLSDQLNETLNKALLGLKKLTNPAVRNTTEYKTALKALKAPRAGGWADIEYRVDGKRTRITGLTTEQTYEAKVIGEIDVGETYDPWRAPSLMPEWASRFELKVAGVRRLGPRRFKILLERA